MKISLAKSLAAALGLFAASLLPGQTSPAAALRDAVPGTITGRIFNPASGEYIRDA